MSFFNYFHPASSTVTIDPPTDETLTSGGGTGTANTSVPAAANYVKITNKGGLAPADITVNGITLEPGDTFERKTDYDGVNRYILPAYTIVTNGSLVEVYYET